MHTILMLLALMWIIDWCPGFVQAKVSLSMSEQHDREALGALSRMPTQYSYSSEGRRDPFVSTVKKAIIQQDKGISKISESPTLDAPAFQVLGIMSGRSGHYAVIRDSKNRRYVVSEGDMLRLEKMRIKKLTATTVVLEPVGEQANPEGLITLQIHSAIVIP